MSYLLTAIGLALLYAGGEALVHGSVAIARRLGISEMAIGIVLIGFGTSAPELLVSVQSAMLGHPALALGNVLGSNIANILLIVGAAAIVMPIRLSAGVGWRESAMVLLATVLVVALALLGRLGPWSGMVMLAGLGAYLVVTWHADSPEAEADDPSPVPDNLAKACGLALAGLVLLVVGADVLVDGAVAIARTFGIDEEVIGVTVVALGSSLPELAASMVAAFRGRPSVAVGNVLGSNLFNLLGALGLVVIITPVDTSDADVRFTLLLMLALTGCFVALIGARRIGRLVGAIFVVAYGGFIALQLLAG